jgi:GMP synthase (glutamine-hydrolysing)
MKICFKKVKNIFAICWGMQVAVKAAGGEVKKSINGPNIGVSLDIKLTDEG